MDILKGTKKESQFRIKSAQLKIKTLL